MRPVGPGGKVQYACSRPKSCQISANNLNECVRRHTNTVDNIKKSDSGTRMLISRLYHPSVSVGYANLFSQMSFFVRIRVFSRDCLQLANGTSTKRNGCFTNYDRSKLLCLFFKLYFYSDVKYAGNTIIQFP
jgi:hypothetical protein